MGRNQSMIATPVGAVTSNGRPSELEVVIKWNDNGRLQFEHRDGSTTDVISQRGNTLRDLARAGDRMVITVPGE